MPVFGAGHEIVTSSTRPLAPIVGQLIYETDTDNLLIWNGASWTTVLRSNASAAGALAGSYPSPTLAANSVSSSNIVNSTIDIADLGTSARVWASPFWFLTWGPAGAGQYQQRTQTFSVPTRSTCIFRISTTAFVVTASSYGQYCLVDGVTGWNEYSRYFHNVVSDHRTYPTGYQTVNLNAGTYTFRLYTPSGQYTDNNDYAIVSVFGIAY